MIVSPKNLWTGLGFDGALSLIALGVLLAAGFQLTATLVVALVLSFFLIRNLGQALAPDYDGGQVTSISASFVLGFAALSMAMMALVMTFSVTAFGALLWCIPAIALVMFARRTRLMAERSTSWLEAAAVLVFGATTAWLCRWQITAYASLLDSNVLHPWADFFVHGAQVAQFGDPLAAHRGDILEVGRPLAFYHYGMFMLPAALLAVSGAPPGLAIATSALLVLGLLVGMLGCFALALELGGGLAALVAVAAMMLLPDAAALWPGNGLFGFHWLLMTAPGSGYAVGVSAVALLFLTRWLRRARWQDALCCALLVASVALLRAQIFVVLAPACVAVAVCTRFSARAKPVAACVAAAMLLLAMASIFLHPFSGLVSGQNALHRVRKFRLSCVVAGFACATVCGPCAPFGCCMRLVDRLIAAADFDAWPMDCAGAAGGDQSAPQAVAIAERSHPADADAGISCCGGVCTNAFEQRLHRVQASPIRVGLRDFHDLADRSILWNC